MRRREDEKTRWTRWKRVFANRIVLAILIGLAAPRLHAQADTWSSAGAEAKAHRTADSLRAEILKYATFAGFGDSSCTPGELRTFERDTTGATKAIFTKLEALIFSYGAFQPLDSDNGRALMRAVTRLETGGPGPRWDTLNGTGPRAFNPQLPIKLLNPESKQCEQTPGAVPDGFALPGMTGFEAPRDSGAFPVDIETGTQSLNTIRNRFFARHANDPNAVMRSTRVNAYGVWNDYAVVLVLRDAELKGVVPLPREASGSVYAFHRVGAEWRLLAVLRSW